MNWLDSRAFLGFKVWEFSLRSLFRPYGRWFLKNVVLKHPLATLRGLLAYRSSVLSGSLEGPINPLGGISPEVFASKAKGHCLLIAPGFCQKPLDCPAGRFNHDCAASGPPSLKKPCQDCFIGRLKALASRLKSHLYIMTSALEIGEHVLLPSLEEKRFSYILACVCPYSLHPFVLALEICGLKGYVVTFARGMCRNYADWSRADRGIKPERTFLDEQVEGWILEVLQGLTDNRTSSANESPGLCTGLSRVPGL